MRAGEPERIAWSLSAEDELGGVESVAIYSHPSPLSPRPPGLLSEAQMRELRDKHESTPEAVETARWHKAYAEGVQENAGRLYAVLWACGAYRRLPEHSEELGKALALALARFGHSGVIPFGAVERRASVESYVREQMRRAW